MPPYRKPEVEVADFERSLPIHMERAGFRFVGAFESYSDKLVGFAYGYTSKPGQWWYENVRQGLSNQAASEWLENSFQFTEFAISPQFQGQGIGGRLYDSLFNGVDGDRAVLSTLQADTVAHHVYASRGWVTLRANFLFPGVERLYQIMGLELKRTPA